MVGGSTTNQLISMFHGFPWHRPQVAVTWEGILGKVKSEERLRALDAADPEIPIGSPWKCDPKLQKYPEMLDVTTESEANSKIAEVDRSSKLRK